MRRKYLPPLLDTYQDMIFVFYGVKGGGTEISLEPKFMDEVESIVGTLLKEEW